MAAVRATAALEEAGYSVAWAADTLSGLRELHETCPDLVIVSRELPAVNGEDPYLRIRQASYLPIIVLGGQEQAAEMLEFVADAYMTKPLSLKELVARVGALLRRKPRYGQPEDDPGLEVGDGRDNEGDGANGLIPTVFSLASCLMLNKGRLLDCQPLTSEVWGGKEVSLDTLHFYVRHLRRKLRLFFTVSSITAAWVTA